MASEVYGEIRTGRRGPGGAEEAQEQDAGAGSRKQGRKSGAEAGTEQKRQWEHIRAGKKQE